MMLRQCALCHEMKELRKSHIIPNFVSKWMKKTSATGYFRQVVNPNKRVQDLLKQPLLCHECEQKISVHEKHFAEKIFIPFHNGQKRFDYDEWLIKFVISMSWKVGYLQTLQKNSIPLDLNKHLIKCLEIWRKYLLGVSNQIGSSKHHIFFLDKIDFIGAKIPIENRMNLYLLRATDATVANSEEVIFIYSKLPGIILVSHVFPYDMKGWTSTRIYRRGTVKIPQSCEAPGFGEFLLSRVRELNEHLSQMSEPQKDNIRKTIMKNPERLEKSKTLEAILADQELQSRYYAKPDH